MTSLLALSRATVCLLALLLTACSIADSHTAERAQTSLVGLSEVDLQSCLGAPDQHSTFGSTDVLTWYATSTGDRGINITLPVIGGGFSLSGGGYCHLTARVENGTTTMIRYSGETSATFAPDAYCAPIVRSCLERKNN